VFCENVFAHKPHLQTHATLASKMLPTPLSGIGRDVAPDRDFPVEPKFDLITDWRSCIQAHQRLSSNC
jgi:hypothetical protein